ncbi:MAG: hypothetical protein ACREFC_03210, partial [Stellaceae bacterium]
MSDPIIPDKFLPALRWVIAGIALFVFFLEAAEGFREGQIETGCVFTGLFFATLPIGIWWNRIGQFFGSRTMATLYLALGVVGLVLVGIAIGG